MRILGVDPGTALLGYGVVEGEGDPALRAYGVVETRPDRPMPDRLVFLFDHLSDLISLHRPDVMAVEQLFFARNVTTAIAVGQARGVALLAAARLGVPIVEYSPSEVKHAVVGYGKADKAQIQEMVRLILRLDRIPQPDDAADALAVAICHHHTAPFLERARAAVD
ncbi:MAG: crossover junction endodeoxyribonuclease RuvC [Chloroflexota bacterium]|nr:crossover junction endodeoxyribonuclease RuvC [Chloroflexota bacterium]